MSKKKGAARRHPRIIALMMKIKPCRFSFQRGLLAGLACLLLTAVHFGCGDSLRNVLNLPPNGRPVVEDLSNLSRGHRLLIEKWGLQIQAFVTTTGVGIDAGRWAASHFTAPTFSSLSRAYFLGDPPGRPFAAWERTPGATLLDNSYAPNLIGVQFKDEQDITDPQELEEARAFVEHIHSLYPNALVYTNHIARKYEEAEIRSYMQYVKPDLLSLDYYPFSGNDRQPFGLDQITRYYESMQKYRRMGLEGFAGAPIPTAGWLQALVKDGHIVSESEIRLNQFSHWAFGYKWVGTFTYNEVTPYLTDDDPDDLDPILFTGDDDQNPTAIFELFAETNRQSRNLGASLIRLLSTDVRFIPGQRETGAGPADHWIPNNLTALAVGADPYLTSIAATNLGEKNNGYRGDVLVGYFEPLDESFDGAWSDQIYFMIVNGLFDKDGSAAETRQRIRLEFDFGADGIVSLQRRSRQTGAIDVVALESDGGPRYHIDLELEGGTGDLFKYNTGAPFVGDAAGIVGLNR